MTKRNVTTQEHRFLAGGSGGQGVLTLGKLICTAALRQGKQVTYLPAYGSEVRGGAASCHVVISPERILDPVIAKADSLIILNQAAFDGFSGLLRQGGLLVVNVSLVKATQYPAGAAIIKVPATERATEMGSIQAANMMMLGALIAASGLCKTDEMREVIQASLRSPKKEVIELNLRAFEEGIASASTMRRE